MGTGVQAFEYVDCVFHLSFTAWSSGLAEEEAPPTAGFDQIPSGSCRTPSHLLALTRSSVSNPNWFSSGLAEEEGFEPPIPITQDNGFQDRRIQPLCHSSNLSGVLAPFRPSIKPSLTYSPAACLPNKFRSPRAQCDPQHPQLARWGFNQSP